jgi:hypothetical protein
MSKRSWYTAPIPTGEDAMTLDEINATALAVCEKVWDTIADNTPAGGVDSRIVLSIGLNLIFAALQAVPEDRRDEAFNVVKREVTRMMLDVCGLAGESGVHPN